MQPSHWDRERISSVPKAPLPMNMRAETTYGTLSTCSIFASKIFVRTAAEPSPSLQEDVANAAPGAVVEKTTNLQEFPHSLPEG